MSFSPQREKDWDQLGADEFELLVVGGGIVGSGIARDAAMRGLRVALVDQHDFASGTSSRSSRLLHGGLRYLEQGRLKLVREASVEKKTISRIAPHLCEPLGFIFPAYHREGRPLWQLRAGVILYDLLCGGRNFQPSRGLSKAEALRLAPGLEEDALTGAVCYYDGLTNDARLVIDTLRSATRHQALLLNYARFLRSERHGTIWRCRVQDQWSGRETEVKARSIVNATGPWANELPRSAVKLRLTKGIHLVLHRSQLPVSQAVVITQGKRLLFVLPWGERIIVGTTDTDYHGDPAKVKVEQQDLVYLLSTLGGFFPGANIQQEDILSTWAGVRPLIADPDGAPSDISRAHQIRSPEPGWWDVAGGKLTTYRLMAEQAVDQIVQWLGHQKGECRTAIEPLLAQNDLAFTGMRPPPRTRDAVRYYVEQEWAVHLEDLLWRRTGWALYDKLAPNEIREVAEWMGQAARWDPVRAEAERQAFAESGLQREILGQRS